MLNSCPTLSNKRFLAFVIALMLLTATNTPTLAQDGCLTYLPYNGANIFQCRIAPYLPDCPECSSCCRLFALRNDCKDCCIDAIDFFPTDNTQCWGICGLLNDPTQGTWDGPDHCTKQKFYLIPTSGNCLKPGETLIIRICSNGPIAGVKVNYAVSCNDEWKPGSFTFPTIVPDPWCP